MPRHYGLIRKAKSGLEEVKEGLPLFRRQVDSIRVRQKEKSKKKDIKLREENIKRIKENFNMSPEEYLKLHEDIKKRFKKK